MITSLACIATAVYFEARGETIQGQRAVASVIVNRVASPDFPNDACAVVKQKHQFSFYSDGLSDKPRDAVAYAIANTVAQEALRGDISLHGATFYHATYVTPYWSSKFTPVAHIGNHIFYVKD